MPSPQPTRIVDPTPVLSLEPLVHAAARGDRDAFAGLVDRTRTLVCSIAMAILRDVESSQDVAQDVFLAAWRDLRKLRQPASFLPWLRQMTRHRAHHVLRTRVRRRRVLSDRCVEDLLEVAVDGGASPAGALMAEEERQRLAGAIEELPDEAREVVTLYYREGRSVRQVAELLGMREDAVRQRLTRARQRLRASLLEEVGETLRTTAPGAAFTAGVMAITVAAPSVAAASIGGSASTLVGASAVVKLFTALAGSAAGALFGLAGVVIGLKGFKSQARDSVERQQLQRFQLAAVVTVLTAAFSLPLAHVLTGHPLGPVSVFVSFALALWYEYFVWLPRIVSRRLALELLEDPAAARRHRRNRLSSILGYTLGVLCGGAGLIYGLIKVAG